MNHPCDILSLLYRHDTQQAYKDVYESYKKQWYATVMFLYFANISSNKLCTQESSYKQALLRTDFLFPDGVALQIFDRTLSRSDKSLYNLNWTDFTLPFLQFLQSKKDICVHIYGTTSDYIRKTKVFLEHKNMTVWYVQDGFNEFSQKIFSAKYDNAKINILLVGRWTPLQEQRIDQNNEFLSKHGLIVMAIWWLFDFWVGAQKRAPKIVRKCKAERLWRLCTDPKRNAHKVYYSLLLVPYLFRYLLLKRTPNSISKSK